jgi:DNA-directed RNA polymerase subunit beta'
LIPAGTGQREFDKLVVGSKYEMEKVMEARRNVLDSREPVMEEVDEDDF